MSLPISSKIKRARHKKDENVTKAKLSTNMQSKNWPKCPICRAPFKIRCLNCGYTNMQQPSGDDYFKRMQSRPTH